MKTIHTLRRTPSTLLCMAMMFVGALASLDAKAMNVAEQMMLDKQEHQEFWAERRLCRYERHECQLVGGL